MPMIDEVETRRYAAVVIFAVAGSIVTADLATRAAFSQRAIEARVAASSISIGHQVVTAVEDRRAGVRIVLPSPYGK
jgi:hypothetical protein